MPQFDLSFFIPQLFWLFLVFGALYLIISKFIAPKAEKILTNRHHYLNDNISQADGLNKKAMELRSKLEQDLDAVKNHLEEVRKEANYALEADFAIKKQELNAEMRHKTDKALVELGLLIEDFNNNKAPSSIDLAAFIIEKITGKKPDSKLLETIYKKAS